jgi:hypothetical protein
MNKRTQRGQTAEKTPQVSATAKKNAKSANEERARTSARDLQQTTKGDCDRRSAKANKGTEVVCAK